MCGRLSRINSTDSSGDHPCLCTQKWQLQSHINRSEIQDFTRLNDIGLHDHVLRATMRSQCYCHRTQVNPPHLNLGSLPSEGGSPAWSSPGISIGILKVGPCLLPSLVVSWTLEHQVQNDSSVPVLRLTTQRDGRLIWPKWVVGLRWICQFRENRQQVVISWSSSTSSVWSLTLVAVPRTGVWIQLAT